MIMNLPNLGEDFSDSFDTDKPLTKQASTWREYLISHPIPEQLDEIIFPKETDPYSYTQEKIREKIIFARNDIRSIAYNVFYTPAPDLAECLTSWALTIKEQPSPHISDHYLNFIKEDLLYLIAHGFNKKNNRYSHATSTINRLCSSHILFAKKEKNKYFLSSPAILELSWLIACNPISEDEDFQIFEPNDPQWFTVLSHPNFPVEKMFRILEHVLDEDNKTISDGGYVDAIFKNPTWNEHTIEALYLESPNELKPKIVPYLLEHSECPVFLLDRFFTILGEEGKIRFARTTKNPDRLVELAEETNPNILRQVSLNPHTPEEVAVRIVLEISQ